MRLKSLVSILGALVLLMQAATHFIARYDTPRARFCGVEIVSDGVDGSVPANTHSAMTHHCVICGVDASPPTVAGCAERFAVPRSGGANWVPTAEVRGPQNRDPNAPPRAGPRAA